jgi:hypothetical protein
LVKPAPATVGKTLQSPSRSDWISRGEEMPDRSSGCSRKFDEPIVLADGRRLVTLHDSATYITALPDEESFAAEWQAAIEALILAVEQRGPTMLARIGVMRALNRHVERVFDPERKSHQWGKRRKLKRDQ